MTRAGDFVGSAVKAKFHGKSVTKTPTVTSAFEKKPLPLYSRSVTEMKLLESHRANVGDHLHGRIAQQDAFEISRVDGLVFDEGVFQEIQQGLPVVFPHQHQREIFYFSRLNEGGDFKKFINGSKSSGHRDESVRVFGTIDEF